MQTNVWAALGSTHISHSFGLNSRPLSSIEFYRKRNKAVSRGEIKGKKKKSMPCFYPKAEIKARIGVSGRNVPVRPPTP